MGIRLLDSLVETVNTDWSDSDRHLSISDNVLDVKSHLSYQHALNQLETAVLDSTHTMHKRLRQDEV